MPTRAKGSMSHFTIGAAAAVALLDIGEHQGAEHVGETPRVRIAGRRGSPRASVRPPAGSSRTVRGEPAIFRPYRRHRVAAIHARLTAVGAVRIGLVGCGFAAEHRHLPTLMHLPDLSVAAVCDVDETARSRVGERFGIARRHASAHELAADPSVEAVAVCVPTGAHVEVALAAIEAGKHVFVEKPIALSLDDADT